MFKLFLQAGDYVLLQGGDYFLIQPDTEEVEVEERNSGGYLTPREKQIIAAQNEDELLIKFVGEFLEQVS